MALDETIDAVFAAHPDLVENAHAGSEQAFNRLTAKVMDETGIGADAARASIERTLADGTVGDGIDAEGFIQYMEKLAARGDRSDETAYAYTLSIRKFKNWYEADTDPSIPPTADDVRDWLEHLAFEEDLQGSTIQRHYHGVAAYFDWDGRGGDLAEINVTDEYPDRSGGTPDYLDWEKVEALREATIVDGERNPYEYAIVQLLSGLGIRVGELVDLNLSDVDLEQPKLEVERQKRSAQWVDPMYLLGSDIEAIQAYLDHRAEYKGAATSSALFITTRNADDYRASTGFIRERLNDIAIRADIWTFDDDGETKTEVSPHVLRHSVGAKLAQNGYSEYEVGRYLGHSHGTSSGGYMALDQDDLEEMRRVLD